MFKFLKDKLKKAVETVSEKVETEGTEKIIEEIIEETVEKKEEETEIEQPKKKGFFSRIFKKEEDEVVDEEVIESSEVKEEPSIEEVKEDIEKIEDKVEEIKEELEATEEYVEEKIEEKKEELKEIKEKIKEDLSAQDLLEQSDSEKIKEEIDVLEDKVEVIKDSEEKIEKIEEKVEKIKEDIETKPEKAKEEVEELLEEVTEELTPEPKDEIKTAIEEIAIEEKAEGFFAKLKQKVVTKTINEKQFEDMFWEIELAMLENNVAIEVIEKIKQDLKTDLVNQPIKRGAIESTILNSLKKSLQEVLTVETLDFDSKINSKKPYVITFVGINGCGKTTSIGKFVKYLQDMGKSVIVAAGDTFRAAAIEQLEQHANNLGVKMIKHDYGSDPAAVAFDAIKYAESHNIDVVLVDTAGRMHSSSNLMDEMKKIIRVAKPDMKIFVGESITGNDCVEQAQKFDEAIDIDGIVLTKSDVDDKGGAAVSVSYVTQKPILFITTGQDYPDLEKFDVEKIMDNLGL